jgi:hypothetical protein
LKKARDRRDEMRKLVADGIDSSAARKQQKLMALDAAANTFEAVAREWFEKHSANWEASYSVKLLARLDRRVLHPNKFGRRHSDETEFGAKSRQPGRELQRILGQKSLELSCDRQDRSFEIPIRQKRWPLVWVGKPVECIAINAPQLLSDIYRYAHDEELAIVPPPVFAYAAE